jgi:hypothetical protein
MDRSPEVQVPVISPQHSINFGCFCLQLVPGGPGDPGGPVVSSDHYQVLGGKGRDVSPSASYLPPFLLFFITTV